MVTRRSLLKQGAYAALALRAAPSLVGTARAQTSSPSTGFDYYISPNGSDKNPGTQSQPWAITAINTHRAEYAGKRVGLLDGTYNVHALCQAGKWSTPALAVNGGPTAASPTVIAAVNPRKAILTGADPSTGAYPTTGCGAIGQGYMQTQNKGNVTLDGLFITRSFQYGIMLYAPMEDQKEGGSSGFTVRNCEIYDIGGVVNGNVGGVMLYYCTGALVSNNQIHSVQPPNIYNANLGNAAGIFSFNSHSNIYEYNTIFDCNSGIHDKNNYNGNHTYRYNYVECLGLTPAEPITDGSGGNAGDVVTAHNNVLVGPGGVWNGSDALVMPSLQSLVFYNNTCLFGVGASKIDSGIFYPAGVNTSNPPATVTFYNNVMQCVSKIGYAGLVNFCAGSVVLSDYNCFSAAGSDQIFALAPVSSPRGAPKLYSLAEWRSATELDAHSTISAAAFANAQDRTPAGFQLLKSSPGVGAARVGGVASGAATDVGAWGGDATQIGCNFGPTPQAVPLSVK